MKKFAALALLLLLTGCSGSPLPSNRATPPPSVSSGLRPACQTDAEQLRLATAYKILASSAARYGYYQLSRSTNQYMADGADIALKDRFAGTVLSKITRQVSGWPMYVEENFPEVEITDSTMNSTCTTAVLQTVESWSVVSAEGKGKVLFKETNQPHTVKLVKAGGIISGKWVVVDISNFNPTIGA